MYKLYQIFCLLCFLISGSCWAESRFFPHMNDIPLMDGVTIQSTEDVNFDTPVGQIISVGIQAEDISSCRILAYYHNILPEMGWQIVEPNKFVREKDTLLITVIQTQNPAILRFEITLNNPTE